MTPAPQPIAVVGDTVMLAAILFAGLLPMVADHWIVRFLPAPRRCER